MLEQPVKNCRRLSLRRLTALAGACLGALVLAGAVIILVFGGAILDMILNLKQARRLYRLKSGPIATGQAERQPQGGNQVRAFENDLKPRGFRAGVRGLAAFSGRQTCYQHRS